MDLKADQLLLNRYKIISKLGRGGFADVYRAFDTRMEREVAIKCIRVRRHSAERVLREARTVALLNHPNIVTIHEFEEDGSECYLIMELIDGVPLSKILGKIAPLSPQEAIVIAIEICRALEAAHQNGIIHRDIKPENVMVLHDGRLKVTDFGIARLKGMAATMDDNIIGTFAYMSPEQARGDLVDERSDLFSLGIVLYEMVTDSIPFGEESVAETLNMVQNADPPLPSEINPSLDSELDGCIMTALEKDRNTRYQSAADFREHLEDLKPSAEPAEKTLAALASRYMDMLVEKDEVEEAGWRDRFWRFLREHRESITRTPIAILLAAPVFLMLHSWFGLSKGLAGPVALLIYFAVLLRPDYGTGIAFLILSIATTKYSLGLSLIMLFTLLPYWAIISRRWPALSISPVGGVILALAQMQYIFPVLVGLLANPLVAALIAGIGCIAFELTSIFLKDGLSPEIVKGYSVWSLIKGQSNPIFVAQLIYTPFIENPVLIFQPVLWMVTAAASSLVRGTRRWFFATLSGFMMLVMGYQGIFAGLKSRAFDMNGVMQDLSFSLIILLLLPIFRPPARELGSDTEFTDDLTTDDLTTDDFTTD